jgi:hypothetical protein
MANLTPGPRLSPEACRVGRREDIFVSHDLSGTEGLLDSKYRGQFSYLRPAFAIAPDTCLTRQMLWILVPSRYQRAPQRQVPIWNVFTLPKEDKNSVNNLIAMLCLTYRVN